jgi:hypothetical protein
MNISHEELVLILRWDAGLTWFDADRLAHIISEADESVDAD